MSPPPPSVLVVDDDDGLLLLIAKSLKREGIGVLTAASCAEALTRLGECSPDLLLLDLKLPDAQGHELIERLGGSAGERSFIIMTGQGDERVAVEMMKRGALDYLVKDGEFLEVLPARVGRALRQLAKDRKIAEAEEALRREHAFTSALLHTSAALVVVLEREGRIMRFNPACERTSGYGFSEVRGRVLWEVILPPKEQEAARETFHRLWERGGASQTEGCWLTRTGERRLIAWSHATLRDAAGRVEYVMSTGIDLTERRRLEQEILQVSEMEQRRIGHDLHDGICQYLVAVELMSQVLRQKVERRSKELGAQVAQIAEHVREAIAQTRSLARGLSPVLLDADGLTAALEELATTTERLFKVRCLFHRKGRGKVTDLATATHLYRIAQEAVNNAAKHARASLIEVTLATRSGRFLVEVADDGIGMPEPPTIGAGMGLHIMQYRASMIGASLKVSRRPAAGTVVACSVPWNQPKSKLK